MAIFTVFALITPLYFVLKPLFIHIGNPGFVIVYLLLAVLAFTVLAFRNHSYLSEMLAAMSGTGFISRLHPLELVYLRTGKLAEVVNGVVNQLLLQQKVQIYDRKHLVKVSSSQSQHKWEYHVLESVSETHPVFYPALLGTLLTKPVFSNIANSMDALKKYIRKSRQFGRLFYFNFCILTFIWVLGFVRLMMGVIKDKPIVQILIAVVVLTVVIIWFLYRLCNIFSRNILPDSYKMQMEPMAHIAEQWDWQYFLLGTAVLLPAFKPVAGYPMPRPGSGENSGGCSSDSSCGSSCSGCGGCGGD